MPTLYRFFFVIGLWASQPMTHATFLSSKGVCKGMVMGLAAWTVMCRAQLGDDPVVAALGGGGADSGWDVWAAEDGGCVWGGETYSYGLHDASKGVLGGYDGVGMSPWYIFFGGERDESVRAVAGLGANTYVMTGYTTSHGGLGKRMFVSVYDRSSAQWRLNQLVGEGDGQGGTAVAVQGDGGYVVGGNVWGADDIDMALVGFFPNHTKAWNQTFDVLGGDDVLHGLACGPSVCAGVGTTDGEGAGGKDVLAFAFDGTNGTILWSKTVGHVGHEEGYGVAVTRSDEVRVAAYTDAGGLGSGSGLWVGLDRIGTLQWATGVGSGGTEVGYDVALNSQGDAWLTGATDTGGIGQQDMWVVQMRNQTLVQALLVGGTGHDVGRGIAYTGRHLCAVGTTLGSGAGGQDVLSVRWPTDGMHACVQTFAPQTVDLTDVLTCRHASLRATHAALPLSPVTWQMYGVAWQAGPVCMTTPSPTLAPTGEGIKVVGTVPTQTVEVGRVLSYQVVPDQLFQAMHGRPFVVEAHGQGQAALPSFLTFNVTTQVLVARPHPSDAGSYALVLVATDLVGASANLVFTLYVDALPAAPETTKTPTTDVLKIVASFVGPLLAGCIGFLCTVFFCKKQQAKQEQQVRLLEETHKKVHSDPDIPVLVTHSNDANGLHNIHKTNGGDRVPTVNHNNHHSIVELGQDAYTS